MPGGELILVIDGEAQSQRFLRSVLTTAGLRTAPATTGADGLRHVEAMRPAVVLLELNRPDMDGKDVIRAVRATSTMPIVVLSARDAEAEKVASLELGADDFVAKPFSAATC